MALLLDKRTSSSMTRGDHAAVPVPSVHAKRTFLQTSFHLQ